MIAAIPDHDLAPPVVRRTVRHLPSRRTGTVRHVVSPPDRPAYLVVVDPTGREAGRWRACECVYTDECSIATHSTP